MSFFLFVLNLAYLFVKTFETGDVFVRFSWLALVTIFFQIVVWNQWSEIREGYEAPTAVDDSSMRQSIALFAVIGIVGVVIRYYRKRLATPRQIKPVSQ